MKKRGVCAKQQKVEVVSSSGTTVCGEMFKRREQESWHQIPRSAS